MKPFLLSVIALLLIPFLGFGQIKLEKRSFIYDKVGLLVPQDFTVMTATMMGEKYPGKGQQPDVILTNETGEVNILISFLNQHITKSQVTAFKDFQINSLKKSRPDAKWLDEGVKTINGRDVGYIKFISTAADQTVFNYYFFTEMEGRVLFLTFNCTEKLLPQWKETADTIVWSLKVK